MECKLLRVLDFKLNLEGHLPSRITRNFSRCLFEPIGSLAYQQVGNLAEAISNDSFFTYANLLFPVHTVALAAVLLAAARQRLPSPLSQAAGFNFEGCFAIQKNRFQRQIGKKNLTVEEEAKLRTEFETKSWLEKIDSRIDHTELLQCIEMLTNFYTEMAEVGL